MTHALAHSLKQAGRVCKHCAIKETDIGMRLERVDVSKRCISHTKDWASVVQNLADIRAAIAHALKPTPRRQAKRIGEFEKPVLNPGIAADCICEPQKLVHLARMAVSPAQVEQQRGGWLAGDLIINGGNY